MRNAAQAIVYLHGFRSSPASAKAGQLRAAIAALDVASRPALFVPELSHRPALAMAEIDRIAAACDPAHLCFVGSSLGGFYATVVAERHGGRAVVLNPAVDPARDLAKAVGSTTAWHSDAPFEFRSEYVDELRALAPPAELTDPGRYLAVIATGDEVLSWREMRARYEKCRLRMVEGSDHALSDFDEHLPAVLAFLGLAA